MAKKTTFIAKALVNITHSFETVAEGGTIKLSLEDAKELLSLGLIEMVDTLPGETENAEVAEDAKGGE